MQHQIQMFNPLSLSREISILYELGLEDYEIQYIFHLRLKERNRMKWNR